VRNSDDRVQQAIASISPRPKGVPTKTETNNAVAFRGSVSFPDSRSPDEFDERGYSGAAGFRVRFLIRTVHLAAIFSGTTAEWQSQFAIYPSRGRFFRRKHRYFHVIVDGGIDLRRAVIPVLASWRWGEDSREHSEIETTGMPQNLLFKGLKVRNVKPPCRVVKFTRPYVAKGKMQ